MCEKVPRIIWGFAWQKMDLLGAFRTLQQYLLKKPGGDREMVDMLALVLQHDEQAVLNVALSHLGRSAEQLFPSALVLF